MKRNVLKSLTLMMALCAALPVQAQSYPSKPVRMVVPFPVGTGTDMGARLLAQQLQATTGQPFVVDNKPGASGSIGAMEVVRAAPDGYTLLFASNSAAASNVALLKSMPYDPSRDLTPIAGFADSLLALMVRADHPARTLDEFLAHVAQRPGKISAGYGSASSQVSIAVLNKLARLEVLAVPYKGIPLAVNDTIGGIVDFTFVDMGNAIAQSRGGKMRALGVTAAKPSGLMPEWRALGERLPGFDISAWLAVLGPAGMPADVVDKLSAAIVSIVSAPEMRDKLVSTGMVPMPMSSERLGRFVPSEIAKWKQWVKDANIQPE